MTAIQLVLVAALAAFQVPQGLPALPGRARQAEEPRPEVALELLSPLSEVGPGDAFEVGLRYRITPGWHIYWHNPGDSGAPTTARLQAPAGFTVRGPFWPAPERFEQAGGIVTYGYEGDPVLFFRVQAPADLAPGRELRFAAASEWLVCKEACFLGDGEVELALRSGAASVQARSPADALLDAQRARLPRPWSELAGARVEWKRLSADTGEGAQIELALGVPGAEALAFFPAASDATRLLASAASAGADGARLVLRLEHSATPEEPDARARGVLRVQRAEGTAWHELDLDAMTLRAK